MRGNRVTGIFLLLLSGAVLLAACGKQEEIKRTSGAISKPKAVTAPEEMDREIRENKGTLTDDAYEIILDGCTSDFICGYLVDESFLLWFTANFGEEKLLALKDAIEQGRTDPELWFELSGNSMHVLWNRYCESSGFQMESLDRVYQKACAGEDEIVLDFTGDINFAQGCANTEYMDRQANGLYDCFSAPLLEEMNRADIMMINNEFAYSDRGAPLEGKTFTFRARPERVNLLDIMGVDIVSVANNHTYDYGPEALVDTLEVLEAKGMPYVGAGRNIEEAEKPSYFIANGRKIAIVSATQIERTLNYTKEAGENTPGVLKTLNPDRFISVIQRAKSRSDYVIVFVHWGTEGTNQYESDQVELGRAFVEAGADAIIGGHTHCLQGFEYVDGVPVIYSLGNFWFSSKTLDTGLSQLVIHRDGSMDFRFLPCIQKNFRTYLVEEEAEKRRIWDFMISISNGVTIDDEGYVRALE